MTDCDDNSANLMGWVIRLKLGQIKLQQLVESVSLCFNTTPHIKLNKAFLRLVYHNKVRPSCLHNSYPNNERKWLDMCRYDETYYERCIKYVARLCLAFRSIFGRVSKEVKRAILSMVAKTMLKLSHSFKYFTSDDVTREKKAHEEALMES